MLLNYKSYHFRLRGFVIQNANIPIFPVARYFVRFGSCCCSLGEVNANYLALKNLKKSKEKRRRRRIWKLSGITDKWLIQKITWNHKKNDDNAAFGSFHSGHRWYIHKWTIQKITWNHKKNDDDAAFGGFPASLISDQFRKLREIIRKTMTTPHLEASGQFGCQLIHYWTLRQVFHVISDKGLTFNSAEKAWFHVKFVFRRFEIGFFLCKVRTTIDLDSIFQQHAQNLTKNLETRNISNSCYAISYHN